jgi:hypothetical protein
MSQSPQQSEAHICYHENPYGHRVAEAPGAPDEKRVALPERSEDLGRAAGESLYDAAKRHGIPIPPPEAANREIDWLTRPSMGDERAAGEETT